MEKIPTLFIRDPENMKLVTREVNPDAAWVLDGFGFPTVKKDGTNVRVHVRGGLPHYAEKRRNPTRKEKAQGAEPGYVDIDERDPANQHILSAITHTNYPSWPDGVYYCEALGPKIQGGIESSVPMVYPFSYWPELLEENPRTWDEIRRCLERHVIEGIVWHHSDGRMAKIKRRDFGLAWPVKKG
jgi:hypothetical protein